MADPTTTVLAKLIGEIHRRPRQAFRKMSAQTVKEALADIEETTARPATRRLMGKGAMAVVQNNPHRMSRNSICNRDTMAVPEAERLAKLGDPVAALAAIHAKPRVCGTPRLGSK